MVLEKKVLKYQLCREGTYALIIITIMGVIMEILGKEESLARLRKGIELLSK